MFATELDAHICRAPRLQLINSVFILKRDQVRAIPDSLPPLRLLIVEDETLVSLLIETTVRELGHEPVGCAYSVPDALTMLDEGGGTIDAAMLDVNLGGRLVFPVAEALEARCIPYAFLTGYGAHGVPARFSHARVMQKPFTEDDLADAMALLQKARHGEAQARA